MQRFLQIISLLLIHANKKLIAETERKLMNAILTCKFSAITERTN